MYVRGDVNSPPDLDTIDGGSGGQECILLCPFEKDFTVTENGNLTLDSAGSFTLSYQDTITFVRARKGNDWLEVSRSTK
jgi:hypothetical protein